MTELQAQKTPYEIRKHFEVSIDSLAKAAGHDTKAMRNSLKCFLMSKGLIRISTTELPPETMEILAESIGFFGHKYSNTPPEERGHIDWNFIDFSEVQDSKKT